MAPTPYPASVATDRTHGSRAILDPRHNPETNEVPEETTETEDTDTEATKGGDEHEAESEPPA